MPNLLLLAACLALGALLRRVRAVPADGYRAINALVIWVALPALVLEQIPALELNRSWLVPALMPWLVFALTAAGVLGLWHAGRLTAGTAGALLLTAGLGNTSFVGLPMIEAFYGKEWLGVGVVADQLGTFLCLNLPGILLAARLAAGSPAEARPAVLLRQVLLFPPFLALVAALALRQVGTPASLAAILARLAALLTPLALFSVGMQLSVRSVAGVWRRLAAGLAWRLVAAPALAWLVFVGLLGQRGTSVQVTLFEAAMAPMITGSIFAQELGLDPELAAAMVGVGVPLSLLTLPLWAWALGGL